MEKGESPIKWSEKKKKELNILNVFIHPSDF